MTYKILQIVHDKPGISKTKIVNNAGAAPRVNKIVFQMIVDSIIIENKHGLYNEKTYELTSYGEKIYSAMDNLFRTIQGDDPYSEEDFVSTHSSDIQIIK